MSDESVTQAPGVFSSKERAALVARALGEAARRARFSTRSRRRQAGTSYRARRGERRLRRLQIATFVGFVVIPSLAATTYFGFIAADQFAAEARFTVRGGLPPSMEGTGSLDSAPVAMIIQDTQVIVNYLESRAIVEALDKSIGLARLYQDPEADYLSRLGENSSIEKIVRYWTRHIDLQIQMPAGIVVMTVRAFRPDDAVTIADAALASSEVLVNRLNDQMRSDALVLAKKERERAQARLAAARAELEKARNREGMLSATDASTALNDLLTQVRGQLIKSQQEYDSLRRFEQPDAPQLRNLQTRIDASKMQVARLQAEMTSATSAADGDRPLSGSMSRLDYALLNDDIAEKIYAGALAAFEHATIASETKLMYINTFVKPVVPQDARYPRRALDISIVLAAGLAVWAGALGLIALLRRGLV